MKTKVVATVGIILISLILVSIIFVNVTNVDLIELRFESSPINFDEAEILAVSNLRAGMSIFSIDETELTKKIEDNFPARNVNVKNIERVWPNKVVLYLKERIRTCIVNIKDSEEYAVIDMDFQMKPLIVDALDNQYIFLTGITVDNTFNIPQFAAIRQILIAFTYKSIPYYALSGILKEIEFDEKSYTYQVTLRNGMVIKEIAHNTVMPPELNF
ncbi:MAG: FtsQ-type POTRA domain-containing protein [Christensenellaceae bacterium]|nr:FtsQ-type POTRA domain-containing protein [Christensenellaceae bacterium]